MKAPTYYCEAIVPIKHEIIDGMYIRTAYAKKDQLIIGCAHKKSGIAFLQKGKIRQIDGEQKYDIEAPFQITTQAGSQRYAYAIEDTIYTTIHRVEAKTVEEAELEVFETLPQISRIKKSYQSLLLEYKISDEDVQEEMNNQDVIIEDSEMYYLSDSPIHGLGCFANKDIKAGENIAISLLNGTRMTTARYVNHSDIPNAKQIKIKDDLIALIAMVDIPKDYEILTHYKETIQCQE